MKTIVMGVNEEIYDPSRDTMISNASCTTNCLAPVAKVLHENFGLRDGMMTTVHSYTNDQSTLDSAHSKFNRGRANAMSMIPTTTGAAEAIGAVLPELEGRLHGIAVRVPTPDVSLVDLVADLEEAPTREDINEVMRKTSESPLGKFLGYEEDQCVSMDYVGDSRSSIFAAPYTIVLGHKAKVLAWYDNEWGYACRCVDLTNFIIRQGL
jgi:glyceraldehyde 3-phosphate dehydrogenase